MVKEKIQKPEETSKAMREPGAANSTKKKFKGVRMRSWGSWVSEIRAPNQKTRIWLGSYSTAEAAARAYDAALLCLRGSSASANLNFPSSISSIFIPQDIAMSPKSIQKVAAAAANTTFEDRTNKINNNNNINNASSGATNSTTSSLVTSSSSSSSSSSVVTSSSSFVSSPSCVSSSCPNSDAQVDDDISALISPPLDSQPPNDQSTALMESWCRSEYGLQSPKYFDQMLGGSFYDIGTTHLLDDLYEESDISLWSFN